MHHVAGSSRDRPRTAWVFVAPTDPELVGHVRFDWVALDAWFEEDEQVFVHARNPYTRVDALRSRSHVRIRLEGQVLAESDATVMVFETGLPTRYYFDRTSVDFTVLRPSGTQTACPYKGRTGEYWSAAVGASELADIAWSYLFPTAALLRIAGLVAFDNAQVEVTVDGVVAEPGSDLSQQSAEF